jgi:hypothetical protein
MGMGNWVIRIGNNNPPAKKAKRKTRIKETRIFNKKEGENRYTFSYR